MDNTSKVNQLISKYQQTSQDNNPEQCQKYINEVYKLIDPVALKSLKCYYKYIDDSDMRECLRDEFWVYFMENIDKYDIGKDNINSFIYVSVKHAASKFFSKTYGMTSYYNKFYSLYKEAIDKYENEVSLTEQQLSIITGIPLRKITYCQQANSIINTTSYEQIAENTGIYPEDTLPNTYGNWIYFKNNPEYVYIRNEETESFNRILKNSLT